MGSGGVEGAAVETGVVHRTFLKTDVLVVKMLAFTLSDLEIEHFP